MSNVTGTSGLEPKLTRLSVEEQAEFDHYLAYHMDEGMDAVTAGVAAWKDLQYVFERLQQFDGPK